MSIAKCCTPYFLGCFSHCDEIHTGLLACCTGWHQLSFVIKGIKYTRKIYAIEGAQFVLPARFNEDALVAFMITDPLGQGVLSNCW